MINKIVDKVRKPIYKSEIVGHEEIECVKYVTSDGKVFDKEDGAIAHESTLESLELIPSIKMELDLIEVVPYSKIHLVKFEDATQRKVYAKANYLDIANAPLIDNKWVAIMSKSSGYEDDTREYIYPIDSVLEEVEHNISMYVKLLDALNKCKGENDE